MSRLRRRRVLALAVATAMAAPVVARAASLNLASQHLTTVATCGLIAYSSATGVDNDTFVDQSKATTNNGATAALNVQSNNAATQRTYIRFNLTRCIYAPASTVVVRAAWLRLFVTKLAPTCRTVDVFAVGSSWTDTTITWNTQPNPPGTTLNNPASSQRTTSQAVGNVSTCANKTANSYVSWDVTTDVANWVSGTVINNGWFLRDDVEGSSTAQQTVFSSINANKNTQGPELMISYSLV